MLALVFTHGNDLGIVEKNVCGLQNRIGEEPNARRVRALFRRFVLELRHSRRFAEAGDRVEHPGELRVGGHVALHKERRVFGVDTRSNVLSRRAPRVLSKLRGILRNGDRVKVDDAEHRIVRGLHVAPLQKCTGVVAEMKRIRAGLHSGEESWLSHGVL